MSAQSAVTPYRVTSIGFIKAYGVTMRPYLLFLSGITGMAGMALAPDVNPLKAVLIGTASFFSYGFGQALTDCFQIDTDKISSPYRPLTQGLITPLQVLIVSIIGLGLCVGIVAILHPINLVLGVIAGAGLATYTPFKRRWWGGPWYNAWIVGVLFVMGHIAGGAELPVVLSPVLGWTVAVVFAGYANFVLSGYFKDIAADRQAGYNTLPVVFGRTVSAWTSDGLAFITGVGLVAARAAIAPSFVTTFSNIVSWAMVLCALGISLRAQISLHHVQTDDDAHRPIGLVVHTYMLALAGITAAARPDWAAALIGFYGLFVMTLFARPSRTQI